MDVEPSNTPTQDEAFLQAISKSRSKKKEMDELDQEFNNLRIPKPKAVRGRGAGAAAAEAGGTAGTAGSGRKDWEAPDYSVLNGFNDEMRGNFIQVVKVDLFRKDGGRKVGVGAGDEVGVDGRPNFKKFKKASCLDEREQRLTRRKRSSGATRWRSCW
jgi:hypothetical protein